MRNILFTALCSILLMSDASYSNNEPFEIELEEVTITGAPAIHSFSFAQYNGKWLFIGGRTNGLHGFTPQTAFPRQFANKFVYVIDPNTNQTWSRNLFLDLPIAAADPLRSTNQQHVQIGNKLYITGGFGLDSTSGTFITFPYAYSIDVPGIISAVTSGTSMSPHIAYANDTRMQVTGGEMDALGDYIYLFGGHKFTGIYFNTGQGTNNQQYTNSYKKFKISQAGSNISITDYTSYTDTVNYHRRDLNLVPAVNQAGSEYMIAYGGVFRYDRDLPFRTPIVIDGGGASVSAYQMYMNQYTTAHISLFDSSASKMHTAWLGGMSLYYMNEQNQQLTEDTLVPFIDDISVITRSSNGSYTETILPGEMPDLLGTNAQFIVNKSIPLYANDVIKLNKLTGRTLAGHFYGGIKAEIPNLTPSTANDKIYRVFVTPKTVGVNPISTEIPGSFALMQNYPNPFNPITSIEFDLPSAGYTTLRIYNALGELVTSLVSTELRAGKYKVSFDAERMTGGVYFYSLNSSAYTHTKKMLLIK